MPHGVCHCHCTARLIAAHFMPHATLTSGLSGHALAAVELPSKLRTQCSPATNGQSLYCCNTQRVGWLSLMHIKSINAEVATECSAISSPPPQPATAAAFNFAICHRCYLLTLPVLPCCCTYVCIVVLLPLFALSHSSLLLARQRLAECRCDC